MMAVKNEMTVMRVMMMMMVMMTLMMRMMILATMVMMATMAMNDDSRVSASDICRWLTGLNFTTSNTAQPMMTGFGTKPRETIIEGILPR